MLGTSLSLSTSALAFGPNMFNPMNIPSEVAEAVSDAAPDGIQAGDSLLDVGCGFADLYFYLKQQGIPTHYQGIDIVKEFSAKASALYPTAKLSTNDIFSLNPAKNSVDYVMLSGALNYVLIDNYLDNDFTLLAWKK